MTATHSGDEHAAAASDSARQPAIATRGDEHAREHGGRAHDAEVPRAVGGAHERPEQAVGETRPACGTATGRSRATAR